jgi:predicted nucleic acid-binding protein
MFLTEESHAVNPTVLHETYHTCVFKLRRRPEDTVRTLSAYMDLAVCLRIDSSTVRQGLKLALNHSLGGRDSLILASYLMSKEVRALVTFDETLLRLGEIGMGKRRLKIVSPRPRFRT